MEGSIGKALRDARLQQKLTIEEVARGTKIRPARIVDLENDDYMHFPNLAYARSFLVLYAKHLRVDITQYPTVEVGSAIGTGDYQYLQSNETPAPAHSPHEPVGPPEKPRWLIAFFVFLVMIVLGVLAGLFFMQFMRLGSVDNLVKKDVEVYKAPAVSPTPGTIRTPASTPSASPSPTGVPVAIAIPVKPGEPENTPVLPAEPVNPVAVPAPEVTPEIRKAQSLISGSSDAEILAQAAAEATAAATPASAETPVPNTPEREIKIKTTRKIKIRLIRDDPSGAPSNASLYLGFINPLQPPVSFKGRHFWIKTSDPDALVITLDGKPVIAGPESGVEIQ